ncbi:MAG: hypothetical protein KDD61_01155, partial [Bdellovibrionales bacterium]|nr:hypothetical protein [Bdellovibrionales bacterium]
MKVRGILCSLLSIFYFLSPSTALGNPSLTELAPTRTTNPIFLTAPQAQFLSQILRQISEANSNYTQGNFSTARQLAQAILQNIELSSYLQADAKALLRDQIQNFQTQIANQPDCRVGFSQGCQPLSNDIFLLAAMATLKGVDQSINVAGNPPPVVPLPTTPVGPNQPLPINPIGSNPGFPGGGSGGITLPVMPTPGIGVPTNPIQPGFPTFPGTFVPRYGQEPLPIMDDIMESVLKAMGVLDIDYA